MPKFGLFEGVTVKRVIILVNSQITQDTVGNITRNVNNYQLGQVTKWTILSKGDNIDELP